MGRQIPITSTVVDWAIRESGLTPANIAQSVEVDEVTLERWRSGVSRPTVAELRALARAVERPVVTFFLPAPPRAETPSVQFRHPPGASDRSLLPVEAREIRAAGRIQKVVSWATAELEQGPVRLPRITTATDPEKAGRQARDLLSATIEQQRHWSNESTAFKEWREALEKVGVLVFSLSMGPEGANGFSVWDEFAPLVAVNTHVRMSARIFTLFHEFGHLLTRTDSICLENHGAPPTGTERWCEQFAAAVLMPRRAVEEALVRINPAGGPGLEVAKKLAARFRVSLTAATLRLISLEKAGWPLYRKIPSSSNAKTGGGGGPGRTRVQVRLDKLGRKATGSILAAVRRDLLTTSEAMRYLDVSYQELEELGRRLAG